MWAVRRQQRPAAPTDRQPEHGQPRHHRECRPDARQPRGQRGHDRLVHRRHTHDQGRRRRKSNDRVGQGHRRNRAPLHPGAPRHSDSLNHADGAHLRQRRLERRSAGPAVRRRTQHQQRRPGLRGRPGRRRSQRRRRQHCRAPPPISPRARSCTGPSCSSMAPARSSGRSCSSPEPQVPPGGRPGGWLARSGAASSVRSRPAGRRRAQPRGPVGSLRASASAPRLRARAVWPAVDSGPRPSTRSARWQTRQTARATRGRR